LAVVNFIKDQHTYSTTRTTYQYTTTTTNERTDQSLDPITQTTTTTTSRKTEFRQFDNPVFPVQDFLSCSLGPFREITRTSRPLVERVYHEEELEEVESNYSDCSDEDENEMGANESRFEEECRARQNEHRRAHGVAELKRSKKAAKHASDWAKQLASQNKFEHSNNKDYGENIASHWDSSGKAMSGNDVADMWYRECEKYDYSSSDYVRGTGHFTQMVWSGSQKVGIGTATTKDGKMIIVANYKPPGNIIGEFKDNVYSPKK